jgi:hypothetical protein
VAFFFQSREHFVQLMLGLDLSPLVLRLLSTRRVDRQGPRGDRGATAALLEERGFPAHEPALAFEERFGGVQVFEADADPAVLVVGPYACFALSPYSKVERDLVPMIFGADDTIYTLDARGRGWVCAAMVEGVSRPCARDDRQLLSQAILWRALVGKGVACDVREGPYGAAIAAERKLSVLDEATSDHEAWWGDRSCLVVEIPYGNGYQGPMTYVGCSDSDS